MKKTIARTLALLLLSSVCWGQEWFGGSFEEALSKAKTENKNVLIDFYSPT